MADPRLLCAGALTVLIPLPAQNHVVSPSTFTQHEGSGNNSIPFFGASYRYQQLHGDLKGTPRLLTGIGWRRDGMLLDNTAFVARSVDMEVWLGDGDFTTHGTTFASNYVNPPTNALVRKVVSAPDHVLRPDFQPAAFMFAVMFDTPVLYIGLKDLLWEVVIHANTNTTGYALDSVRGNDNFVIGGFTTSGVGCSTSNGAMKLRTTHRATLQGSLTLTWAVAGAPSNAISVVLTGLTNPRLPLPGLCSAERLYTDAALVQIAGTTTATGTLSTGTFMLPFDARLVGLHVTAQAVAIDASRPLGVVVSNGNDAVMPPQPTNYPVSRLYASSATAVTGSRESYNVGLVTRFSY